MFDFDLRRKIGFRRRLTPMDSRRRPRLDRRNAVKHIDYDAASTSWASSSSAPDPSPALSPSGIRASRSLDLSPSDLKTSFRIGGGVEGEVEHLCRSLGLSGPDEFAIPAADWAALKSRSSPSPSPAASVADPQVSVTPDAISSNLPSPVGPGSNIWSPVGPGSNLRSPVAVGGEDRAIRDAGSPDLSRLGSPGAGAGQRGGRPVGDNNTEVAAADLRSPVGIRDSGLPNLASLDVRDSDEVAVSNLRSPAGGGEGDRGIRGARPPVLLSPNLSRVRDDASGSNLGGDRDRGIRRLSPLSQAAPVVSPPPALLPLPPMSRRYLDKTSSAWDIVKSFAPDEKDEDLPRRTEVEVVEDGAGGEEVRVVETEEELTGSCLFSTDNEDDSSSTTTEPAQVISPSANGRFRRIISSWEKGRLLGSGSFGTVYEGISDDGNFFAVKEVSLIDQGANAKQCIFQLEQEIALLSQFEHENIVQYYGTDKEEANLFIFLELVTQGSLASLYQRYHLRDSQVSAYTRQILSGLKYLHDRNVVHRDIKCTNILVHANGSIKLADFGLAKEITKLNVLKSCKGSVYWMAPEVIQPKKTYGSAADIWSLGCTVLEMLTRQVPYPNLEWTQALFRIGRGEKPVIPDSLSSDARDFISQCIQVNPDDRPTAAQLLDHAFVKRLLPAYSSDGSSHGSGR